MSCGNKKQTKESGVHLTERTCSPYNPIIRQIVDDCLGLPVYPVTSIDAVIDEEGNTLRKLLQNLLDQIKSGNTDVSAQIEEILQAIEELQNNSADDEEFQELKNLVKAIASKTDIETPNLTTVVPNTNTPVIVDIINKILEYLGIDPANPGEPIPSASILDLLVDLVVDIANLNPNAAANQYTDLDVDQDWLSIPIIYKVLELINFIGVPKKWMGDTLHERVLALEAGGDVADRIDALERTVGSCEPKERDDLDLCTRMGGAERAISRIIEGLGDNDSDDTIIDRIGTLESQVGECLPDDNNDKSLCERIERVEGALGLDPQDDDQTLGGRITKLERQVGECDPEGSNIPNLCQRVGNIEDKIGDCAETDSICTLISNINDDIDEIKANLGDDDSEDTVLNRLKNLETNSAHLDPEVLKLMPEYPENGTAQEINQWENNKALYLTLKMGEYPPDNIDIMRRGLSREVNRDRFEYYGELGTNIPVTADNVHYDVYPFGHTDLNIGNKLFLLNGANRIYLTTLVEGVSVLLMVGDGNINVHDMDTIGNIIMDKDPNSGIPNYTRLFLNYCENYDSSKPVYMEYGANGILVGSSPDSPNTVNISTLTEVISLLLTDNSPSHLLPSNYQDLGSLKTTHWLYYYKYGDIIPKLFYPCIKGKLYHDYYTGELFQFALGRMFPVQKNSIIGANGITVSQDIEYVIDDEDNLNYLGPYYQTTISLSSTIEENLGKNLYISGGVGQLADAIDHINTDYGNLTFEWTLLDADNEFSKMIRFVPSPATLAYYANPNTEPDNSDTVGTFIDITNGNTEQTVSYGDIH